MTKLVFPLDYGVDSTLVEIDKALLPIVSGALSLLQPSYIWLTDVDYELGYNAIAALQLELMGKGINKLILEIRALRGVDDLTPGYDNPDANPFSLSLGTVEDNKRAIEASTAKLEEIRLLLAQMETATELEDIAAGVAEIAALLAV